MFFMNGFVYGSEPVQGLRVTRVRPLSDMVMLLTFNTGETRLFDATVLRGPVYAPLRNKDVFNKPEIDHGVVTWQDGAVDCAPEYMYDHSYEYAEVV